MGRVCEICGWGTDSLDKHLCEECRIRLRKMLYPRGKLMMNNRKVIYLDDAIDAIKDLPNCPNGYSDTYDKARIISVLEEVPPAPYAERRQE